MSFFTRIIREPFFKEPLLHFLIIGVMLFLVYGVLQKQETILPNQIVVSQGQVQQLAAQFKRVSLRSPTPQELDKLIEGYIRDEVFYRQGLILGLDIDDPVVKQRMRMKLEVLLEDLNEQAQPSDDVLLAFMGKNADNYIQAAIFSFEHVFIDLAKHKNLDEAEAKIKQQIAKNIAIETLGDRLILPAKLTQVTDYEINRLFGEEFAQGLTQLSVNEWSSVVYSGYGAHLVKLTDKIPSQIAKLSVVKTEVVRDYLVQRREELKDKSYQNLLSEYIITIEKPVSESILAEAS